MRSETANSLVKSVREAGEILRGEVVDFESWQVQTPSTRRRNSRSLGVFVGKDEDLVAGKIYEVKRLSSGRLVVTSETGESVILESSDFLLVKFQPKAEKLIRELVTT